MAYQFWCHPYQHRLYMAGTGSDAPAGQGPSSSALVLPWMRMPQAVQAEAHAALDSVKGLDHCLAGALQQGGNDQAQDGCCAEATALQREQWLCSHHAAVHTCSFGAPRPGCVSHTCPWLTSCTKQLRLLLPTCHHEMQAATASSCPFRLQPGPCWLGATARRTTSACVPPQAVARRWHMPCPSFRRWPGRPHTAMLRVCWYAAKVPL